MRQPWIHKGKTDFWFILFPTFFVLGIVIFFHEWLLQIQDKYSFYTWLFLIVFIDVAHVYSTLFKTYFVKSEFLNNKKLYVGLPVFCFLVGLILYGLGSNVFWSVLAYIAVFHFIRQQYGFLRLYARREDKTKINRYSDALIIYAATIYPMLYWFFSSPREYNWFVENEFYRYESGFLIQIITLVYVLIVLYYVFRTLYCYFKTDYFNIPKNLIIIGTLLSWFLGIVYYNNDLVFTLLNVVSHGIPYIALIYLKEINMKSNQELGILFHFKNLKGIFFFLFIVTVIAFFEEFLWEILIWKENFNSKLITIEWQFLVVPLLTVPQFTHYLLDGFIWKNNH
ncbi:hypothetical protein ACFS5J_10645 [Flavobacterium chuncheonense]|uniref:Beta-carotene 15,15'-monooxygenase n=1 Tax=Flavobacterium chuncheonense TaxID=2026653 RepID=A0ABW5YNC3_9FLAO